MANIINLATETNQEKILDKIQNVDAITTDAGLNVYNNIISAEFEANSTNSFTTILNVQGSGELLELVINSIDSTSLSQLKITVDGKVILLESRQSSVVQASFNIFLKDYLLMNMPYSENMTNTGNLYFYSLLSREYFKSYLGVVTSMARNTTLFYLLKNPITFKESLKIEGTCYTKKDYTGNNVIAKSKILYRLT